MQGNIREKEGTTNSVKFTVQNITDNSTFACKFRLLLLLNRRIKRLYYIFWYLDVKT